jgi:hypothetical protein
MEGVVMVSVLVFFQLLGCESFYHVMQDFYTILFQLISNCG